MLGIHSSLKNKVVSHQEAAAMIRDGNVVAVSGYTSAGDPKGVLLELANLCEKKKLSSIDLISAAQLSNEVENRLAKSGLLQRRAPFSTSSEIRNLANMEQLHYVEVQMSKMPRLVRNGAFGEIDFAIIEAMAIGKNGDVVLTSSVGMSPQFCMQAKNIIIEINSAQPEELFGVHDLYETNIHMGGALHTVHERIGKKVMHVDVDKIKAIVFSDINDELPKKTISTTGEIQIANQLQYFLRNNYAHDQLAPIQTGIGNLSKTIIKSFDDGYYDNVDYFCGALQEEMVCQLKKGIARYLSGSSVAITNETKLCFKELGKELPKHLFLRDMEISNGAASIASVGLIALNTGLEMDMFGNLNSSHVFGSRVINGIGGGATFAQNSILSVVLLESSKKNGNISTFVPRIPHIDIVHHDVDVVISEQGIADLRGKDDIECALEIIKQCAHPDYKEELYKELRQAIRIDLGHHPINYRKGCEWHARLAATGSMKVDG